MKFELGSEVTCGLSSWLSEKNMHVIPVLLHQSHSVVGVCLVVVPYLDIGMTRSDLQYW